jgi:hypothetical protein
MNTKLKKLRVAVVGIGSAGIQSICHIIGFLPTGSEVIAIYDPKISNLGIGESTNPAFVTALERGLGFDILNDIASLNGTYKFGTKYFNWRVQEFTNPLIQGGVAIHFDTHKLAEWAIVKLKAKWGDKFNTIQGAVTGMQSIDNNAYVTVDQKEYKFDYVFDCRGFPKEFSKDYHVITDSAVNHCLVHNKQQLTTELYTGHRATQDGWMFEVPLATRHSYGYLFNNTLVSAAQAKVNFSKEINIPVDQLDNSEYRFSSYYTTKLIQGRIIKNGNRAAFFEPMFANSLFIYNTVNCLFWDLLTMDVTVDEINNEFVLRVKSIEDMISFHYHGGCIYDTPFWQKIIPITTEKVKSSQSFNRINTAVRDQSINNYYLDNMEPSWVFNSAGLINISNNLGYNYFNKSGVK